MFATVVNRPGRSGARSRRQTGSRKLAGPRCGRFLLRLGIVALLLGFSSASAPAALVVNEIKTKGTPKKVEVKNTGPGPVQLADYGIRSSKEERDPIEDDLVLGSGEVHTFLLDMRNRGDCIELFDATDFLPVTTDQVFYGDNGGAPQDMEDEPFSTIARVDESPDPSGVNSAQFWNLDYHGTLGQQNDALPPELGVSVKINEVVPGPGSEAYIELFNPSSVMQSLFGWALTSATTFHPLFASLGPGAVQGFNVTDLVLEYGLNAYLMRADSVRVDQIGLADAPGDSSTYYHALNNLLSFQRCPEGSPPHDGFDLWTSGYPFSLRLLSPTLDLFNNCEPGAVGGTMPALRISELSCRPNPFNPMTSIRYALERAAQVDLAIYDSQGHRLVTLQSGRQPAGSHRLDWNGAGAGGLLASGVYYLQLRADGTTKTLKTVLAR